MAQQIMPVINDIPQLHGVYMLNDIKILDEEWTKKYQKIKSIHTSTEDLYQRLQFGIKQYHRDSISMSFITANEITLAYDLNRLDPAFMYTQLFKDILLDMEYGKQAIKRFTAYCRNNNSVSLINIDRFEKEYHDQLAIWWYTFPSNIFSMLNYGLRALDADIIITMGFFLRDIHEQIQQLYEQQFIAYGGKSFVVYRGQGLMKTDFEKLQKTKGGLISFNNFLSTSKDKEVSIGYARIASTEPDKVGILFIMSIDPCIKSAPFASIKDMSFFEEEDEILFSMHTVFRVTAIKQTDNESQLHQVELQLTSDDDQELRLLTDQIRQEVNHHTGYSRLGSLLLKIGQFNKAEELFKVLIEQTSDEDTKAVYYHDLGYVKYHQGAYEEAISYYEQKPLPSNHPSLANSYNDMGIVYIKMGEHSRALAFYEKALEILHQTLPSNHPLLASSYNNIGNVYDEMGEYPKGLSFYEKSLEIQKNTLPPNHPSVATSYNNIGLVYVKMGEYSKALSFYEKALEIREKTLPSDHPDFGQSYNNIGLVYVKMGEYSKALSFYEKALESWPKTLPSNHPDLATSYNNIGTVYNEMEEYSKALSFYEKSLEIYQKTLSSNHPLVASSYNNIGTVYDNMKEYSKALSFYEKAFEILQQTLPSNHPLVASSYSNIGLVYIKLGENSKALSYHERALEIREKALPLNHRDLASSYGNIGIVYALTEEYSRALSFYEKAVQIYQKTLPSNHPLLASSYSNIGWVYRNIKDYSKALSYFERALNIYQNTLPPTHPDIEEVKESIGIVKEEILKE
ncbi:unnamed protein product [Adineta steineri]|uniref:Multifunctional fusion protein n=1 Tax=Adineta steineri TaxID=433720 RepID=A0A819LU67_9BILA|nr:unnamed protein product [Adineta steineri]CAF3971746.1 unnamed protein product [Adineta steineri]